MTETAELKARNAIAKALKCAPDAVDADAGDYNGTRINVALGTVGGGQTRTVTFQTTID